MAARLHKYSLLPAFTGEWYDSVATVRRDFDPQEHEASRSRAAVSSLSKACVGARCSLTGRDVRRCNFGPV